MMLDKLELCLQNNEDMTKQLDVGFQKRLPHPEHFSCYLSESREVPVPSVTSQGADVHSRMFLHTFFFLKVSKHTKQRINFDFRGVHWQARNMNY